MLSEVRIYVDLTAFNQQSRDTNSTRRGSSILFDQEAQKIIVWCFFLCLKDDYLLYEYNRYMQAPSNSSYLGERQLYVNNASTTHKNLQSKPNKKICERCKKPILQTDKQNKSTLKALGKYYHEECFTCNDCFSPLKPKYFPFELPETGNTILLCQYDYFRRHHLLCHVCDKPLRGLYYTAFGERYDEEHFSCSICGEACGVKKCFMNDDKLYCRYHFLKYFSKNCNGCQYPISDQYIEFPKGDEIHSWHPECYGIHKYWHVTLSSDKLGLLPISKSIYDGNSLLQDNKPTREELDRQMQLFYSLLTKTWCILYKFEEQTAACISDMFQHLASIDQLKGLESTALFVLKIECLFKALVALDHANEGSSSIDASPETFKDTVPNNNFNLKKISRNLTTKIMIYLQLLRKLNSDTESSKVEIASFMSIITGLAHFAKLLTRYGLYMILERNKKLYSSAPLLKFLKEVEKNELYENDPFKYINLSIKVTDNCFSCGKYIQEDCIQFQEKRWHKGCLSCSSCSNKITQSNFSDATFNLTENKIICSDCSIDDPISIPGFKYVKSLSQLIFLLKIALIRSKAVTETQLKNQSSSSRSDGAKAAILMQQTYVRTLSDITRLKSRRESVRIAHKQDARMSMVLEKKEQQFEGGSVELEEKIISEPNGFSKPSDSSSPENVFSNSRSLTLDDISRIVAAEQARELRPNAFTHFKKLKEVEDDSVRILSKGSGIYYSELTNYDLSLLRAISLTLLTLESKSIGNIPNISQIIPVITKLEKTNSSGKFWNKMKIKRNKDSKKNIPKQVFGTPLEELCMSWGIQSDLGVGPSKIQVPIVVDELISSLRQMDLSVEGIFRINGNIRKLREITTLINSDPGVTPDFSKESAIQLSALLKKFIRTLPEPIMTNSLYSLWIDAAKLETEAEKRKIMSLLYTMLPTYNRNVLEVILSFLFWTSSFSHIENEMGSKMDIHNLSTVITPNILYQSVNDEYNSLSANAEPSSIKPSTYQDAFAQNEGENYFLAIEVVDFLITQNEDMAMVPNFLVSLLNDAKENQLNDYEMVRSFVLEKSRNNSIQFDKDEHLQKPQTMKVIHSSTVITQNDRGTTC